LKNRQVVVGFDGGTVSPNAGALLLGRTDEAIGLIDRLAGCFVDSGFCHEQMMQWCEKNAGHSISTPLAEKSD
jgi:hypothetical protein